jgi:putative transposase
LNAQNDRVVEVRPLLDMAGDWKRFLADHIDAETVKRIRDCQRTGRPLGSDEFIADLEVRTGRILRRQRTGPKPAGGELGIVSPN